MGNQIHNDCNELILSSTEIENLVDKLSTNINNTIPDGEKIILLGILKGSVIFLSDLARKLKRKVEFDFMTVSSYQGATRPSGGVKVQSPPSTAISKKHTIIVEDIVDTGRTINFLHSYFDSYNPKSLHTCTLLDKPARRTIDVDVDYTGQVVPDEFLVGYGMDYKQKYRNLPYIATLKQSIIDD